MGPDAAVRAVVIEELPQGKYRLKLENETVVVAHPGPESRKNFVRLLPGDPVEVELTPHDWTRGRIVKKLSGVRFQVSRVGRRKELRPET